MSVLCLPKVKDLNTHTFIEYLLYAMCQQKMKDGLSPQELPQPRWGEKQVDE